MTVPHHLDVRTALYWILGIATASASLNANTITRTTTIANNLFCNEVSACTSNAGLAFAAASTIAADGYVAVFIEGSAYGTTQYAQASASSFFSQDYLILGPSGSGALRYDVALSGYQTGIAPGYAATSVRFNGELYQVPFGSSSTVYSFTRTFTYNQPFSLFLQVDANNSWMGFGAESGYGFASARLVNLAVVTSEVPEPSTAVLWTGGAVLLFAGMRRTRVKR